MERGTAGKREGQRDGKVYRQKILGGTYSNGYGRKSQLNTGRQHVRYFSI